VEKKFSHEALVIGKVCAKFQPNRFTPFSKLMGDGGEEEGGEESQDEI